MKNLQRALVAMGCMFSMAAVALPVQAAGASEGGGPVAGVYAVCNCPNKYMEGETRHCESLDGTYHMAYYNQVYTCATHGTSSKRMTLKEYHAYRYDVNLGHIQNNKHRYEGRCTGCGNVGNIEIDCTYYTYGSHSVPY